MTHSPDKINILTACNARAVCTKQHKRDGLGGWRSRQYSRVKNWRVETVEISSFDEMAATLDRLATQQRSCLIRDRLKAGGDRSKTPRSCAAFDPQEIGLRVLCIDIEDVSALALTGLDEIDPTNRESLEYAVEGAIGSLMPETMHGASCYYQWSASAGVKEGAWKNYRLHLWFFLDRPVYRGSLKRWASSIDGVDPSVFNSVHIHYTADPLFYAADGSPMSDIMGSDSSGSLRSGVIKSWSGDDDATAPAEWLDRPSHEVKIETEERAARIDAQRRAATAARRYGNGTDPGADEMRARLEEKCLALIAELPATGRHGYVLAKCKGFFAFRDVIDAVEIARIITPAVEAALIASGRSPKIARGEAARMIDPLVASPHLAPASAIKPRSRRRRVVTAPPRVESPAIEPVEGTIAKIEPVEGTIAKIEPVEGTIAKIEPVEIITDERGEVVAEVVDLVTTKSGDPKTTLSNVVAVLTNDHRWRGVIAFDELALTVITTRQPPWGVEKSARRYDIGSQWSDGDDNRLRLWLQREYGFEPPQTTTRAAVDLVGEMNSVHPVRDWLNGLNEPGGDWRDEDSILNTWLSRFTGAPDDEYTRLVGRWWLIAAVARVHPPRRVGAEGVKADNILVLEGKQGQLKSTVFRTLAPVERWFSDSLLAIGDKDALQSLKGKWLYELAELDGYTSRKDAAALKAFVTSAIDDYRASYGARNVRIPRQCLFCGTANKDQYFRDHTGNRRFWPVKVGAGSINIKGLNDARGELWAQALAAYNCAEVEIVEGASVPLGRWWPVGDRERALLEFEQKRRLVSDSWETTIERYLRDRLKGWRTVENVKLLMPTVEDLLRGALNVETARFTNPQQIRVRNVLTALGFKEVRSRRVKGGPRERFWTASGDVLDELCPKGHLRIVDSETSPF